MEISIVKLNGVKLSGLNVETVVLPRGDGQPIVFKIRAVPDLREFEKFCPEPVPPTMIVKGGARVQNDNDPHYQQAAKSHSKMRLAYMLIKGMQATESLEWEKVRMEQPSTWLFYEEELKEAGLNQTEINRVIGGVMTANALDDDKVEEAKKRFFASEELVEQTSSSQTVEPSPTQSGEPASGSA